MSIWTCPDIDAVTAAPMILDHLVGDWAIVRTFDHVAATLVGVAVFAIGHDGALDYREDGHLRLPDGQMLAACRRYLFQADGCAILIRFADGANAGAPFVRLNFTPDADGIWSATDTHRCGDDLYRVEYRMTSRHTYVTAIDVDGPRKRHRAVTAYQRAPTR